MSAIAGLYNVDGRPADPVLLKRMIDALAHRGPDGEGQWVSGPIGLGHRLLHTTPESVHETQPFANDDGGLVIICDGRIDNRTELNAVLAARGVWLRTDTDIELILRAYEVWGTSCATHLIGDFAFAIWDQGHRRLFCARDSLGVKPFYYYWDGKQFLFASEIKAVLAAGIPKQVNEAMLADYFCSDFRDPEATFFAGIKQLQPAHSLCVEDHQLRLFRYWEPNPHAVVSYQREEDYFEQFREVFREAVRCRLRSRFPIGVSCSGGIDSTSVTAMAEAIRQENPAASPPLTAFTRLAEEFLQEEWKAIERLVQRFGTTVHIIRPPAEEIILPLAENPYQGAIAGLRTVEPARALGCRVLLTGFGADELERPSEIGILKDLLRGWRLLSLAREIRRLAWTLRTPEYLVLLELRDQLPPRIRWILRILRGRQVPRWIEPDFARRFGLAYRLPERVKPRFPTMSQEESFRCVTRPEFVLHLNQIDYRASQLQMEWRHPYLDRRLMECFLSIPSHVKLKAGYQKRFARCAFAPVTGSPLTDRKTEGYLIPPRDDQTSRLMRIKWLEQALRPHDGILFRYVRPNELKRTISKVAQGRRRPTTPLWRLAVLSQWLHEYFPQAEPDDDKAVDTVTSPADKSGIT